MMKKVIRWLRVILGTGMSTILMVSDSLPGTPGPTSKRATSPGPSIYQIRKQIGQAELLFTQGRHDQASKLLNDLTKTVSEIPQDVPDRQQITTDLMNLKKKIVNIKGIGK